MTATVPRVPAGSSGADGTVTRGIARLRSHLYCRQRLSVRAASGFPRAEPGVHIEHPRNVAIGPRTRLLRGASVLGNGGTVTIGADALIARWSVVQAAGGSIVIGDRSGCGDFCNLYGQGGLTIGADVLIASGVRVHTAEHRMDRLDLPIRDQGELTAPTTIEDGAWIGANAVVLAGVRIGAGAVVAAGAVVTRDVEPRTVVAGVPARPLRTRTAALGRTA